MLICIFLLMHRLEKYYAMSHNAKLSVIQEGSKLSSAGIQPVGGRRITTSSVIDEDGIEDQSRSRVDSAIKPFGETNGTGAYDVEDMDDYGYIADEGMVESGEEEEAGEEEDDEKVLEELEDKQLLARIGTLEGDHKELLEQVKKLEHGRTWVENRLTSLESDIGNIKGSSVDLKTKVKD